MYGTVHIDGLELYETKDGVIEFEYTDLTPPKEVMIALAPGLYYRYTSPQLIEDNET